ncbi:MAG: ABC transporter ATP-binding protein [Corynebacterium sp.]|nr:ABC transporter ATP-binding protein [Corynebacterium sp.]
MIEVAGLTKRYKNTLAVDDLSFTVKPGVVTGFLGPNGAGKSTTMRLIVGLDRPTAGSATFGGAHYSALKDPLRTVGSLLDAKSFHRNRSARAHLNWVAETNGIARQRVTAVLQMVGLSDVAGQKAGSFSLGMAQRLGLAQALLGDPEYLLLDEPVNGLDPEGIRWVREFLQALAKEGRTILVSSHLLSEMSQMADNLVVIGQGKLIADASVHEFVKGASRLLVSVRAADAAGHAHLQQVLSDHAIAFTVGRDPEGREVLEVSDQSSDEVGRVAFQAGVQLAELTQTEASLEEAFMEMTGASVQYHGMLTGEGE